MPTSKKWLITGGAGYIGAHIADEFLAHGKEVVIYDSLYRGKKPRVEFLRKKYNREIPLIDADIRDGKVFTETLKTYKPIGVIHAAALKSVSESIQNPQRYFEINFEATRDILELITLVGIKHFIFSSSAAVYGSPIDSKAVKEDEQKKPISPYGASKLAAEFEVNKFLGEKGNHGTSLRFFNVVGSASNELIDSSQENLVPIVINNFHMGQVPTIFGNDYPTFDGTCIRDYVDVRDVARAHLKAADSKTDLPNAMNVGTGNGASVLEIVELIRSASSSKEMGVRVANRREGDPAFLCADVSLIKDSIGFIAQYSLASSISSLFKP